MGPSWQNPNETKYITHLSAPGQDVRDFLTHRKGEKLCNRSIMTIRTMVFIVLLVNKDNKDNGFYCVIWQMFQV